MSDAEPPPEGGQGNVFNQALEPDFEVVMREQLDVIKATAEGRALLAEIAAEARVADPQPPAVKPVPGRKKKKKKKKEAKTRDSSSDSSSSSSSSSSSAHSAAEPKKKKKRLEKSDPQPSPLAALIGKKAIMDEDSDSEDDSISGELMSC